MRIMKKCTAVFVVLVLVFALGACGGGLNGTYAADDGSSITFDGDKIILTYGDVVSVSCTYEIDGDKITITFSAMGTEESTTKSFSHSGNTITVDGQRFVTK